MRQQEERQLFIGIICFVAGISLWTDKPWRLRGRGFDDEGALSKAIAIAPSPSPPPPPRIAPTAPPEAVLLVTADTRPLQPPPLAWANASFAELLAVTKFAYAKRHGPHYQYRHYYLASDRADELRASKHAARKLHRTACAHPLYGARHASWCKLLAVHHASRSAWFARRGRARGRPTPSRTSRRCC